MNDDRISNSYDAAELAKTYCVSLEEAERLITQFGSNRSGMDFLLAHETIKQKRRTDNKELQGDFLFSI